MTTTNDPDAIRAEIDATRGRLSDRVDVLTESVRPSSVAKRTVHRASSRAGRLTDSVMGAADGATGAGSRRAHDATEAVKGAPDLARQQARGNPLAAGAVALAAGWLVGSLLPASQAERRLSASAKEQAQPLVDEARSMVQDTAEQLKDPAKEALDSVKETAQQGVEHVRDDGASAVQDVKGAATDSAPDPTGRPSA